MSGEKEVEMEAQVRLEEGLRGFLLVEQREESVESPQWMLRRSKVPELVRLHQIHYLTAQDIVTLDTAVVEMPFSMKREPRRPERPPSDCAYSLFSSLRAKD